MRKIFNHDGFTLIEMLVSMSVIVVVGGLVTSILISSLRGTNKTNTLTSVSQNGSFAVNQIAKMTQGAQSFDGVSTDNTAYLLNCVIPSSPTPTPTPTQYKYLKITSFDGGQTTFSCDAGSNILSSNSASLIDTNAVVLASCYFICTQNTPYDYPVININFSLNAKQQSGALLLPERTASATALPFQTSVTVRNMAR